MGVKGFRSRIPGAVCAAAALGWAVAGAAVSAPAASARVISGSARAASAGDFVALAAGPARSGLAVFSASDGHLVRWLLMSKAGPTPVAVSPDGRWVYHYTQAALSHAFCANNGFSEPALWRVNVRGGRPQRAGVRTTSVAFSPDGTMSATC